MDNKLAKLTLAAVAAASLSLTTLPANAADQEMEKCQGVVKAGKNDCATATHSCAGHAKADGQADEWVSVPKGLCDRLVNGKVKS